MEIEFGAPWVDHYFAGIVVEEERHVHALGGYLDPLATPAAAFPFPGYCAVVVAGALGDGRKHSVRADGKAAQFDHAERCAANFRNRGVENEVPALKQTEALKEQVKAGKKSDDAPDDKEGI